MKLPCLELPYCPGKSTPLLYWQSCCVRGCPLTSRVQQVDIPAAQILSWHDNTSKS